MFGYKPETQKKIEEETVKRIEAWKKRTKKA
jgi:hypothetical protein